MIEKKLIIYRKDNYQKREILLKYENLQDEVQLLENLSKQKNSGASLKIKCDDSSEYLIDCSLISDWDLVTIKYEPVMNITQHKNDLLKNEPYDDVFEVPIKNPDIFKVDDDIIKTPTNDVLEIEKNIGKVNKNAGKSDNNL